MEAKVSAATEAYSFQFLGQQWRTVSEKYHRFDRNSSIREKVAAIEEDNKVRDENERYIRRLLSNRLSTDTTCVADQSAEMDNIDRSINNIRKFYNSKRDDKDVVPRGVSLSPRVVPQHINIPGVKSIIDNKKKAVCVVSRGRNSKGLKKNKDDTDTSASSTMNGSKTTHHQHQQLPSLNMFKNHLIENKLRVPQFMS